MTVSLFALFIGAVYRIWIGATRYSTDLDERITSVRRAQLAMERITREILQSRRLLYPASGGADQPGVCVIDGHGTAVMYALDAPPAAAGASTPGRLYRKDLSSGATTPLLDGVRAFWCRIPAVPEGRDPDLVHLSLEVAGPHSTALPLVTSVQLPAVEPSCPLDSP